MKTNLLLGLLLVLIVLVSGCGVEEYALEELKKEGFEPCGVTIESFMQDSSLKVANVSINETIWRFNNKKIFTGQDLRDARDTLKVNDSAQMETDKGIYDITLIPSPNNSSMPWFGANFKDKFCEAEFRIVKADTTMHELEVELTWKGDAEIDFVLYTPEGSRIDPSIAGDNYYESKTENRKRYNIFRVPPGEWKAAIIPKKTSGNVTFMLNSASTTYLIVIPSTDKERYKQGENIQITSKLSQDEGASLSNMSIELVGNNISRIINLDFIKVSTVYPIGSDIYGANISADDIKPGIYSLIARAEGKDENNYSFVRTGDYQFSVDEYREDMLNSKLGPYLSKGQILASDLNENGSVLVSISFGVPVKNTYEGQKLINKMFGDESSLQFDSRYRNVLTIRNLTIFDFVSWPFISKLKSRTFPYQTTQRFDFRLESLESVEDYEDFYVIIKLRENFTLPISIYDSQEERKDKYAKKIETLNSIKQEIISLASLSDVEDYGINSISGKISKKYFLNIMNNSKIEEIYLNQKFKENLGMQKILYEDCIFYSQRGNLVKGEIFVSFNNVSIEKIEDLLSFYDLNPEELEYKYNRFSGDFKVPEGKEAEYACELRKEGLVEYSDVMRYVSISLPTPIIITNISDNMNETS